MSLKKKIILGFLTSSIIIVVIMIFGFVSFIEIRKEIHYLELSDNLRSKSLQLRRHEKNFFLYMDVSAVEKVHTYLNDIKLLLNQGKSAYKNNYLLVLEKKIDEYEQKFNHIEAIFYEVRDRLAKLKPLNSRYSVFFELIESTFFERPIITAELLKKTFLLREEDSIIKNLQELNTEMTAIRKDGEEILTISNDMDKSAREKVDKAMVVSQTTALILFPMFIFVGLWALFGISQSTVKRLKILSDAIEETGKGHFSSLKIPEKQDEIGLLIKTFNKMKADLIARDEELNRKNEELLQSRKLASIGTLASGVAHELNNPLNNIYLASQILSKEIDQVIESEACPEVITESVRDIASQTLRVKRIVSDLLEFAREKGPELKKINIVHLVHDVLNQMQTSGEMSDVQYNLAAPENIELPADRHLMEQVFINLFINAVDAMEGKGLLDIRMDAVNTGVQIKITDTGRGIQPKDISRIFDPFFTTKEKGTGLGLAIAYNIIKKHNGKIDVVSEPDKKTTFTIILPKEQ
ncbi:MAG: HAMP domain-containing protein [Nitrospirae bacterium]|nr:HAMP domain-containing protein [Nitrospirota bacterium]